MRRRLQLDVLLLVAVAFALGTLSPTRLVEAARPRKVENAPYSAELRAQVRTAIRKGITYLREQQMEIGRGMPTAIQFEEAAAVLWVLRRAGVALDGPDDAFQFRILRERAPEEVCHASLLVLALCTVPLREGDPFTLDEDGGDRKAPPLPDEDRVLVEKTVRVLLDAQVMESALPRGMGSVLGEKAGQMDARGGWCEELAQSARFGHADIPNTYLALLALEAAARRGIEIPPERFLAALELLVRWQALKGRRTTLKMNEVRGDTRLEWSKKAKARGFGWTGTMSDEPSGYETAAGVVGIVICKDALHGHREFKRALQKRANAAIHDGLAWIQRRYTIKENPDPHERSEVNTAELYHHHWLQALARLSIHLRMRHIDKRDWYQEGAELLVEQQRENGSWEAIWWSNCYALLFLQRASLRSITPVITPSER